ADLFEDSGLSLISKDVFTADYVPTVAPDLTCLQIAITVADYSGLSLISEDVLSDVVHSSAITPDFIYSQDTVQVLALVTGLHFSTSQVRTFYWSQLWTSLWFLHHFKTRGRVFSNRRSIDGNRFTMHKFSKCGATSEMATDRFEVPVR